MAIKAKEIVMGICKLGSQGRVTIPKKIREQAGLRIGDELEIEITGHGLLLRPSHPFKRPFWGCLKHKRLSKPVSVEDMNAAIKRKYRERAFSKNSCS